MTDITKAQKKEIRDALLGRTVLADNGRITTLEPGFHLSAGVADGAGAVRLFGIASRSYTFTTKLSQANALRAAEGAMAEIGRGLILRLQPEAAACLIRPLLMKPLVLTFRFDDGVPILTAWTGRRLTAGLAIRRAVSAFADELPDTMTINGRVNKTDIDTKPEEPEPKENDQEEVPEQ